MRHFPFNQGQEKDCGWRCLYSIFRTFNKISIPYIPFRDAMRKTYGIDLKTGAIQKLLTLYHVSFAETSLRSTGLFIFIFHVREKTCHSVIIYDGNIYDSHFSESFRTCTKAYEKSVYRDGTPEPICLSLWDEDIK